jgi:hypothetical protein
MDKKERDKKFYEKNREYILERNRQYYLREKDKIAETRKKYYLQKKYGKFIEPAIFIAHGPIIVRFD